MVTRQENSPSFLHHLARDASANTLAISAAAMVPVMAMVGGGVDTSRFYMAATRLQQACDAGALAARQAMLTETLTSDARQRGEDFFDQNYPSNLFGSEGLSRNYTATDGEVTGTATGTLPATIMGAFGFDDYNLSVSCTADINISNTDIMFVIDTTGSMAWTPAGNNCGLTNGLWNECLGSRIQGVRDATMTFYDAVEESTSARAQVRYGVVPYSSGVNVGAAILAENSNWMARNHTYNSRETEITLGDYSETAIHFSRTSDVLSWNGEEPRAVRVFESFPAECSGVLTRWDLIHDQRRADWQLVSQTGTNPRISTYTAQVEFGVFWDAWRVGVYDPATQTCSVNGAFAKYTAEATITVTEEADEQIAWAYRPVSYDLLSLYDDNQMEAPTGWNNALETVAWDGCIEEASTVNSASFDPIPAGANDLDINLVPSNDNERWKPALRDLSWLRISNPAESWTYTLDDVRIDNQSTQLSRPLYFCPRPAQRLDEMTRGDLQTYVDNLQANGATYHDIGMIWGARFIAPNGIFTADNLSAPNGDEISRHIVFLTDGELSPNEAVYTPYGIHWWDRRVHNGTNNTQVFNNHEARFQAACRAARNENIGIWVVAFGTALTQNLIDCATPGRAYSADDSQALEDAFREIAQKIAQLRITD